ncbi:N-acetylmuramoyl-L-alanine amidase [Streptomyces rochei]|uniref:N-acetylmuramoyl-L-alanine amidase n=1 Tax=Streptomyces rochei TaxID=1928 RepID=UPI003700B1CC
MADASWRPIPVNYTANGQTEVRGVVVHIMAGTLPGTDSWFRNPQARASSHFGTGKAGQLYQWVDTKDRAWAQAAGNSSWISVENEGKGGDVLTDKQLDKNALVLAWSHQLYSVPLQVASGPSGRGLGWHAMGGSAWGGHTACPGPKIVAQLPEIVRRAKNVIEEDIMPSAEEIAKAVWNYRLTSPTAEKGSDPTRSAGTFQRWGDQHHEDVMERLAALEDAVKRLGGQK